MVTVNREFDVEPVEAGAQLRIEGVAQYCGAGYGAGSMGVDIAYRYCAETCY